MEFIIIFLVELCVAGLGFCIGSLLGLSVAGKVLEHLKEAHDGWASAIGVAKDAMRLVEKMKARLKAEKRLKK